MDALPEAVQVRSRLSVCGPGLPRHGDVPLKLANEMIPETFGSRPASADPT
jgi:hypothetical protein